MNEYKHVSKGSEAGTERDDSPRGNRRLSLVTEVPPVFLEPVPNVTVAVGRDASLTCSVDHLGQHKVRREEFFSFVCTTTEARTRRMRTRIGGKGVGEEKEEKKEEKEDRKPIKMLKSDKMMELLEKWKKKLVHE